MMEIPDRDKFIEFAQSKLKKRNEREQIVLFWVWRSYNVKRSTNSSTILLLGPTGAGKSHTINNLLNTTVASVKDNVSGTKIIQEFTVEMPSADLRISNAKIHVIDTPGFGDTEGGFDFDAKVLTNIRNFFKKKSYLPNFILLVVNFNDKRLDGKFSSFVKLLQGIKLELSGPVLDKTNPNLIVVLTHLCGALPKYRKDPTEKIILVQKIVAEHLNIAEVPVVVAENEYEECELEKQGDYFLLPNQDLFPRNIYLSMVHLAKSVDPVGHGILNEAFNNLQQKSQKIRRVPYSLYDDGRDAFIVSEIMRMQISTTTELGDRLAMAWAVVSNEDKALCRLEPTEFGQKLATMGYKQLSDLPRTNRDVMNFFRELVPDKGMATLLKKIGVEAPHFEDLDILIGKAYSIEKDQTTSFTLFTPKARSLSPVGCYLPGHVRATIYPEVQFTCSLAKTNQEMVEQRLRQLKAQIGVVKSEFNYECRNGFNVFSHESSNKLTAVYEQRLIKMVCDHSSALNEELVSAVKNLPISYDKSDRKNVLIWKNFFSHYGTHFVLSSFIGGSVVFEINNMSSTDFKSKFQFNSGSIFGFLSCIFGSGSYSDSLPSSYSSSCLRQNMKINVLGGNCEKASELIASRNPEEFLSRLQSWQDTIWENPIVTDLSITLGKLGDVVSRLKPDVVNAINTATEDLYNAKLEYDNRDIYRDMYRDYYTRAADSEENKNSEGASCLSVNTLILTPEHGQVEITQLKAGDEVVSGLSGQPVRVIGVNKLYSMGKTRMFGFNGSIAEAGQPFFTGGHTFLRTLSCQTTVAGGTVVEVLVACETQLKQSHPQMLKPELFHVTQMPTSDIEILGFIDGQPRVVRIPSLSSNIVEEGYELYYLIVEGDGTYVANGFVCYHELPNFSAWPLTFTTIYNTIELLLQPEMYSIEFDFKAFQQLYKLVLKIREEWELYAFNNNKEDYICQGQPLQMTNYNIIDTDILMKIYPVIINNGHCASLGMLLYSLCGELLYNNLDKDSSLLDKKSHVYVAGFLYAVEHVMSS